MFKLLKNLKWIDYLIIVLIGGLVGLQVFLDLRLPDYMTVITQELFGSKDMHIIWVNGGYMLLCAFDRTGVWMVGSADTMYENRQGLHH